MGVPLFDFLQTPYSELGFHKRNEQDGGANGFVPLGKGQDLARWLYRTVTLM